MHIFGDALLSKQPRANASAGKTGGPDVSAQTVIPRIWGIARVALGCLSGRPPRSEHGLSVRSTAERSQTGYRTWAAELRRPPNGHRAGWSSCCDTVFGRHAHL